MHALPCERAPVRLRYWPILGMHGVTETSRFPSDPGFAGCEHDNEARGQLASMRA